VHVFTRKTSLAALAVGLAALTLAACGSDEPDERQAGASVTPVATTPPVSSPAPSATSTPPGPSVSAPVPFPADTTLDESGPEGGGLLSVTDVRVARQDGFDRVTFQLGGTGEPGWRVGYVDQPTQEGSGDPVTIPGSNTYLSVIIRGVGYPADTGQTEYAGPKSLTPTDTTQIKGVRVFGVFEGQYDGVVGISGAQRPFRVFALTNPARVVVDVRDN
jgi:hypothetical protein